MKEEARKRRELDIEMGSKGRKGLEREWERKK
jgi:hypothetical protein